MSTPSRYQGNQCVFYFGKIHTHYFCYIFVNETRMLTNNIVNELQELTTKSMTIVKTSMKYFTGVGTQVGQRISILSDILSTKEEPPRIWYSQSFPTTPRLNEQLEFNVLEVKEHLETYFDRKENVMEVNANCFDVFKLISCIFFNVIKKNHIIPVVVSFKPRSAWKP